METDDELWPPFGPGAEFRQRSGRYGPDRPDRREADRRGHDAARREQEARHRELRDRQAAERRDRLEAAARGRQQVGEPRGRDRKRSMLSRAEIVAAAMEIADRDGAEAVSMRRIALLLHAGPMSLYWHVASKEHLLELMQDALFAEITVPEPTGDWRADLREQARSMRKVFLRHPWVMDFIGARPALGPHTLRNLDKMIALLDGLDTDTVTVMNILQAVNTYVSGAVIREFQEIRTQREEAKLEAEVPAFQADLTAWMQRLAETGMFDHFLRMLNEDIDPDSEDTRDERFEFGLDCVLEGIAAKLLPLRRGVDHAG
jgi:AcrR family transcriptional regulator